MSTNNTVLLPSTPATRHRFHFLDALRGVAAILVVPRHADLAFAHMLYFPGSFLAVDFFFCLSGFVVAFSYENRMRTSMTFSRFAVARLVRLYPLAILGTTLGLIEALISHLSNQAALTSSFFAQIVLGYLILPLPAIRLQGLAPLHYLFPLDPVLWTLFCELVANFVYAALVRRRLLNPWTLIGFVVLGLAGLSNIILHSGSLDVGYDTRSMLGGLARVSLSFSLGVLVFHTYKRLSPSHMNETASSWVALALVAVIVWAFTLIHHCPATTLVELGAILFIFPAVVYQGARVRLPSSLTGTCAFLGGMSYALYVLHAPLLWPLNIHAVAQRAAYHPSAATAAMVFYMLLLVFAAWWASAVYDHRVRRFLTSYLSEPKHS